MNRLSYRPDIDGLRAVAVVGVLFFHAGLGCKGGFVGVDVFFVISGFLITSLILRDLREGTFSFVDFWARRIRRIVPALAVMALAVVVVGYFGMFPDYYKALGKQVIALVLCVSNVKFWRETGYFDTASDEKPLLHTWSLSVEEQFYFIIPIALFLIFRFKREKLALPLIVLTCVVSFAASVYASVNYPSANFYLLPTRAWELGVGSLLAFVGPIKNPKLREFSSFIGLTLIIGCYFLFPEGVSFPGASALPPVLGAALLIWSGTGQDHLPSINRILKLKSVVGIGLISYSLYLWHWPIFAYQKHLGYSADSDPVQFSLLVISFLPAWLSWKYIETPFRIKRVFPSNRGIIKFGTSIAFCAILFGLVSWLSNGSFFRLSSVQNSAYFESLRNVSYEDTAIETLEDLVPTIQQPQTTSMIFVWGDSHARHFMPAIENYCKKQNQDLYLASYSSTAPVIGGHHTKKEKHGLNERSPEWNSKVIEKVLSTAGDYNRSTLIISAIWESYLRDGGEEFIKSFEETLRTLSSSSITKIIIIGQVPRFGSNKPSHYIEGINFSLRKELKYEAPYTNKIIEKNTSLFENIVRELELDPNRFFLFRTSDFAPYQNGEFFPFKNSNGILTPLYRDSHHLNIQGSLYFTEPLSEVLNK